jgi:hypothetical protein
MKLYRAAAAFGLSAAITSLSGAVAETAPARPTDPIYQCASKADDAERLACFDKAVADLKQAETSGAVRTVDMAAVEKIERDSFGFSLPSLNEIFRRDETPEKAAAQPVEEVNLAIASITVNKVTRRATIKLENGQVWEQVDSEELSRSKVRKGKQASIRKASMGSFLMVIDGSGTGIRVRRIA